jgi:serine/threonine-protein kinase
MQPREGRDLQSLLSQGRLEIDPAIRIVIGCCRALAGAEPRGLSPTSILISADLDVTIGDYDVTQNDIGYTSPELANASRSAQVVESHFDGDRAWGVVRPTPGLEIDRARAAVFALGAILWEMLAGRPLFRGATDYQTLELVRVARIPPLPGTPPELEAIVRKALAKNVEDRYQTPDQLGDALGGLLASRALD